MATSLSAPPTAYLETLEQVVNAVIVPAAAAVDQSGSFPRARVAALSSAGLPGLISASAVGGLDPGHRAAAPAVVRVAQACGSTATRVLTQTSRFDHCNFTVISSAPHGSVARFRDLLFAMSYDDPQFKSLMAIEGLHSWKEGRTAGYEPLTAAVNTVRIAV